MPTLGVIIPCKNSAAYLPRHLEFLNPWIDLAAQVIVVDSFSIDGSTDFLKKHLRHPTVQFLTHPPGLYQSWNFGIQQLQTDYAYIATVGDTISRQGIAHLLDTAESLRADVIVSKPKFFEENGRDARDIRWPIDEAIETLEISKPRTLSAVEVLLLTATHLDGTLLGSCASNLFRTTALQKFRFPSEFGKAGDGAWAAERFADVVWAITPEKISTFLLHPNFASAQEMKNWETAPGLDGVLKKALERVLREGRFRSEHVEPFRLAELLDAASAWIEHKKRFDRARQQNFPWIFNPAAWQERGRRNFYRSQCFHLRDEAFKKLAGEA